MSEAEIKELLKRHLEIQRDRWAYAAPGEFHLRIERIEVAAAEIATLCNEKSAKLTTERDFLHEANKIWRARIQEAATRAAEMRDAAERVKDADIVNEWKELKELVALALAAAPDDEPEIELSDWLRGPLV